MRRLLLLMTLTLASTGLVALTPSAASAAPGCDAGVFLSSMNGLRAGQGLPAYQSSGTLANKAYGWAQTMANSGSIFHSNLGDNVAADWRRLGENVGKGPLGSESAIAQAFINSSGHYANLVDPGFRYVGVGVVSTSDTCYVAEEFMELASQPAPSTSASATGTPSSGASSRSSSGAGPSGSAPDAAPAEPPPPPPPPPPPVRLTVALERLTAEIVPHQAV